MCVVCCMFVFKVAWICMSCVVDECEEQRGRLYMYGYERLHAVRHADWECHDGGNELDENSRIASHGHVLSSFV